MTVTLLPLNHPGSHMRAMSLLLVLPLLAGCPSGDGSGAIALNEFVASNTTGLTDDSGDTPDWLELVNLSDAEVALDGWAISDDSGNPLRHSLDGLSVPGGGYLLLFATADTTRGDDHLSFRLLAAGEEIVLSDPEGVVDQIAYGAQTPDVATARVPNGTGEWVQATPTPGESNE